jgi:hypothetical protein
MSEQAHQVRNSLTRTERKQLLALACASDRAAWAHACRPAPPRSPIAQIASEAIRYLEPFSNLLPGRIGRLLRGAGFLTNLGRQFGWLRR